MRPKGGLADSANILMLIVGLTGGMGVGKSTVAGLLSDLGAEVVDVDALGRQILEPGGLAVSSICLLYTSPSPRDLSTSRMPSSA